MSFMFQFHAGLIKRLARIEHGLRKFGFQFHAGLIKSAFSPPDDLHDPGFQFHAGLIKRMKYLIQAGRF